MKEDRLLFIDTETTGLDSEKDRVIEVGAVLWCTKKKKILDSMNLFVDFPDRPEITPFITDLTGIENDDVVEFGVDPEGVFSEVARMAEKASYLVAHNAPFDKGMIDSSFKLLNMDTLTTPWIDTQRDIDYPEAMKSKKLNHLCADYGINPNTFAHRAFFDVMQMIQLFEKHDFKKILEDMKHPIVKVRAFTQEPWLDKKEIKDNDIAKQHGFRWENKMWQREVRLHKLEELKARCSLELKVING